MDSFRAQYQTTEGLFKIDIQMNYDYVALNWLLSVQKSLNWGTKINKTEIRKFENLKLNHYFCGCLNLCVELNFDISNVDYF